MTPLVDYTMRGAGGLPPLMNATGVVVASGSHPGVIPCVLGVDRSVAPTGGGCTTKVYGWNFAPGVATKCAFGGGGGGGGARQSRADYVDATTVRCDTPGGGDTPAGESIVTASNDGDRFTNDVLIGKAVKQLALESSLWTAGGSGYGANADGTCAHLDTGSDSEVSFGGWFCPNCAA